MSVELLAALSRIETAVRALAWAEIGRGRIAFAEATEIPSQSKEFDRNVEEGALALTIATEIVAELEPDGGTILDERLAELERAREYTEEEIAEANREITEAPDEPLGPFRDDYGVTRAGFADQYPEHAAAIQRAADAFAKRMTEPGE